jgi:hypothetical protein
VRCDVRRIFRLRLNGTFGGRTFCKPLRRRNYDTSAVRTKKTKSNRSLRQATRRQTTAEQRQGTTWGTPGAQNECVPEIAPMAAAGGSCGP